MNRPSAIARAARRCDSTASASWSPRVIWWLSARFSAVSPMWMLSNGSCSAASIMSTIAASPMRAPQRMPCARYGARLMLSAPPPTAMSVSPSMMVCAADTIACSPEPHSRFSVSAGASFATPAFIAATRARYMSFGSVWITLPNTTCPTSSPATPARDSASRTTCAPRSVGATSFSPPPKSPIAVRTPDTTTTSRCMAMSVLPHDRIAQRADAADLDLADIAVLHVRGGALGAHPHHVARIQRQVSSSSPPGNRPRRTSCGWSGRRSAPCRSAAPW